MNDLEHKNLFWSKTAIVFGGLLLGGYAALSALAVLDRHDRPRLERLEQPSAVGDPVAWVPPAGFEPGETPDPVITLKGAPLFGDDRDNLRDSSMMKAGTDDSGKIPLYRRVRKKELRKELYIKLAPGEYLELSSKPPKPKTGKKSGNNEAPAVPALPR